MADENYTELGFFFLAVTITNLRLCTWTLFTVKLIFTEISG